MASKTLVEGKAYDIVGGKTMIDGKTYNIVGGKTMVGGKTFSIQFEQWITVTITGTGNASTCYVEIEGAKYYTATALQMRKGSEISATVNGSTTSTVKLNGTTKINEPATFGFTPDAQIVNIALSASSGMATITITTE